MDRFPLTFLPLFQLLLLSVLLVSCGEPRLDDYTDISVTLEDQNGASVQFPDDFEGRPMVVGFIYTNCPDICPFITSNIKKIAAEVGGEAGNLGLQDLGLQDEGLQDQVSWDEGSQEVQFLLITFDPERDTQEVLKKYAQAFQMDRAPFRFLTGDEAQVRRLMERVSVRTSVTDERLLDSGDTIYFLSHSDKILLIDRKGRLVFDYGGSMTPPRIVAEDLRKLLAEG